MKGCLLILKSQHFLSSSKTPSVLSLSSKPSYWIKKCLSKKLEKVFICSLYTKRRVWRSSFIICTRGGQTSLVSFFRAGFASTISLATFMARFWVQDIVHYYSSNRSGLAPAIDILASIEVVGRGISVKAQKV